MDRSAYLKRIDEVIDNGRFKDTWESLARYSVPEWYKRAKFGIFIHWGVYSVPAFGSEWYSRNMYIRGSREFEHHVETYGAHKDFGYKDFIPMFKAEKFDPVEWIKLFKAAGAEYVMPVAEHHDGFQMYDSDISEWNSARMGPKRDVVGELAAECRRNGIKNCVSSHRAEHWFFMGHGREFDSDIKEPLECGDFYWPAMPEGDHQDLFYKPAPSAEYLEDWLCRCCELVDKYRPSVVYFDWWIQHSAFKPYLRKFAAYYYDRADEWGEGVVINYKHDAFPFGTAVVDVERGQFAEAKPYVWQTDTAAAKNSWCYTEGNEFKDPVEIVCDLLDIVSKNGRLLLNIGPKADGTIADEDRHILSEIGKWLSVNGEAVYGSGVWRYFGEGPTKIKEGQFTDGESRGYTFGDIRFTVNNGALYAAVLKYPESGDVCVTRLAEADASSLPLFHGIIKDASVLGSDEKPRCFRDEAGLHIHTDTVKSDYPVVFKIEFE